jgi:hypothetical protein
MFGRRQETSDHVNFCVLDRGEGGGKSETRKKNFLFINCFRDLWLTEVERSVNPISPLFRKDSTGLGKRKISVFFSFLNKEGEGVEIV